MRRFRLMKALIIALFAAFALLSTPAEAQKTPKKQRGSDVQTPENALDRDKADRAAIEAGYKDRKGHHDDLQDKATKKRMKQNYKRSQKQSWGKEIPWYRRMFRKRKF